MYPATKMPNVTLENERIGLLPRPDHFLIEGGLRRLSTSSLWMQLTFYGAREAVADTIVLDRVSVRNVLVMDLKGSCSCWTRALCRGQYDGGHPERFWRSDKGIRSCHVTWRLVIGRGVP